MNLHKWIIAMGLLTLEKYGSGSMKRAILKTKVHAETKYIDRQLTEKMNLNHQISKMYGEVWTNFKPMAIGTRAKIVERFKDEYSERLIDKVITYHCNNIKYQQNAVKHQWRFDIETGRKTEKIEGKMLEWHEAKLKKTAMRIKAHKLLKRKGKLK